MPLAFSPNRNIFFRELNLIGEVRKLAFASDRDGLIPPQVEKLAPCERELAFLIYLHGPMTVKVLEGHLTRELSNSALRSVLGRLCRKKILKRRKITGSRLKTDHKIPYVYSPAITAEAARVRALVEVARDYFDGSLPLMAKRLAALCDGEKPVAASGRPRSARSEGARIAA